MTYNLFDLCFTIYSSFKFIHVRCCMPVSDDKSESSTNTPKSKQLSLKRSFEKSCFNIELPSNKFLSTSFDGKNSRPLSQDTNPIPQQFDLKASSNISGTLNSPFLHLAFKEKSIIDESREADKTEVVLNNSPKAPTSPIKCSLDSFFASKKIKLHATNSAPDVDKLILENSIEKMDIPFEVDIPHSFEKSYLKSGFVLGQLLFVFAHIVNDTIPYQTILVKETHHELLSNTILFKPYFFSENNVNNPATRFPTVKTAEFVIVHNENSNKLQMRYGFNLKHYLISRDSSSFAPIIEKFKQKAGLGPNQKISMKFFSQEVMPHYRKHQIDIQNNSSSVEPPPPSSVNVVAAGELIFNDEWLLDCITLQSSTFSNEGGEDNKKLNTENVTVCQAILAFKDFFNLQVNPHLELHNFMSGPYGKKSQGILISELEQHIAKLKEKLGKLDINKSSPIPQGII